MATTPGLTHGTARYSLAMFVESESILTEILGRPIVYLDTWALNDIAQNESNIKRFVQAMKRHQGTLRISQHNVHELIRQGDRSQVNRILAMIREIDCGFINSYPDQVIKKENFLLENPSVRSNPSSRVDIVADYLAISDIDRPSRWHVADIITVLIDNASGDKVGREDDRLANSMSTLIEKARGRQGSLQEAAKRFHATRKKGPQYPAATRELFRMCLDFILRNEKMGISTGSEWNDTFHVIVPVAYCDIVLIDRRWKSFVSQTGLVPPAIASVFDSRGLLDFFESLEDFRPAW